MKPIMFWVPGNPKGLKRHRTFRTKSGVNIQVDPSASEKKDFLALAMQHRPSEPIREALAITLVCVFQRPKAHFRSNGEVKDGSPCWYASAPDTDNVLKFVGDALNGTFWHDDRQIAVAKVYAVYGVVPGIAVFIQEPNDAHYTDVVWLIGASMTKQEP